MTNDPFLKGIEKDIKELLYKYIKVESYTFSPNERLVEPFLTDWFKGVPYFQEHPELCGLYEIQGDPFDRNVVFGMVKGRGSKAVVLIHHYDVVGIEDFKLLKDYAFKPDELSEKLMEVKDSLPVEAREDLMSGNWLFGRGGCDMKAMSFHTRVQAGRHASPARSQDFNSFLNSPAPALVGAGNS